MGRGDYRTKKGKIFRGTYGYSRPTPKEQRKKERATKADREAKGIKLRPDFTGKWDSPEELEALKNFDWPPLPPLWQEMLKIKEEQDAIRKEREKAMGMVEEATEVAKEDSAPVEEVATTEKAEEGAEPEAISEAE
jgi:ribosomal small subunit protein bTHX